MKTFDDYTLYDLKHEEIHALILNKFGFSAVICTEPRLCCIPSYIYYNKWDVLKIGLCHSVHLIHDIFTQLLDPKQFILYIKVYLKGLYSLIKTLFKNAS